MWIGIVRIIKKVPDLSQKTMRSDIDLILISEDFKNRDYWSRIDILSEAIYDVFAPVEVVGFTPEEWDKQTSPLYDYAKHGEIFYAA